MTHDAVVIGSGPNGLSAAVTLAQAGLSVLVLEAGETIGGGCRTAELTLPGFKHDVCAAVHPMAVLSPAFREMDLARFGLEWVFSPASLVHPLDREDAAWIGPSIEQTVARFPIDAALWRKMLEPFLARPDDFFAEILRPPLHWPGHPLLLGTFAFTALRSCRSAASRFRSEQARALFTGCAAHAILPLSRAGTAAFGLVLALSAHVAGWPVAKGGSAAIIRAMEMRLRSLGGRIETGVRIRSLRDLPESRVALFDLAPRHLAEIARDGLPGSFRDRLRRFQHGPGVFKIDWALDGPIPWTDPSCAAAAAVHLGGTAGEIVESERCLETASASERPFVILAQPSLFDSGRAPAGKHTAWAYCHVPPACTRDMTERIENQIERFAPGFRDRVMGRHAFSPADYERYDPNFVGGDIAGGANTLWQTLFRPVPAWNPYLTPNERLFLCSSSTPPGGGVHGMCGYWAARSALRRRFGIK